MAGTLSSANYDFPNLVNGTLAIGKAHLTVTADDKSMSYGGEVRALTATLSGFVNGDTASVVAGIPTLTHHGRVVRAVGAYPITVMAGTLSSANYDFPNLVNGTLAIGKAHLAVTADGKTKVQGTTNPPLTYTLSGFVNGDTVSGGRRAPVLSTSATTSSYLRRLFRSRWRGPAHSAH